jgi:hypothetical protein
MLKLNENIIASTLARGKEEKPGTFNKKQFFFVNTDTLKPEILKLSPLLHRYAT